MYAMMEYKNSRRVVFPLLLRDGYSHISVDSQHLPDTNQISVANAVDLL